jgi:hypothetical protein
MLVQLNNLPNDVTREEIDELCEHSQLVNSIHVVKNDHSDKAFAWVDINCHSRVGINAICHVLNHKYIHGRHIMAYPSLYSH